MIKCCEKVDYHVTQPFHISLSACYPNVCTGKCVCIYKRHRLFFSKLALILHNNILMLNLSYEFSLSIDSEILQLQPTMLFQNVILSDPFGQSRQVV